MTYLAPSNQEYERRQIVARMGKVGTFRLEGKRYWIWKYITFWAGKDQPSVCGEFVRLADMDKDGFLRLDNLKTGEIVAMPGLIYRKIPMSGMIMAEHMKKMKRFRPRDVLKTHKDTAAGAVDLGVIDLRTKH